jgi:hypothetical protein
VSTSRGQSQLGLTVGRRRIGPRSSAGAGWPGCTRRDPSLANRRRIEDATVAAVKQYEPGFYAGRADVFLPSEAWRRSGERPHYWTRVAREVVEHVGPDGTDGTDGDNMLLEPRVRSLAALLNPTLRPSGEMAMQLTDDIDRRVRLTQADFAREYLSPPRPVILTDALVHWRALGRWSRQFFKTEYGHLEVRVDGERMTLRELVDRIEASSEDHPATYLRDQTLAEWPPGLTEDVYPMPECTRPNWLQSRFFPARGDMLFLEVYIGGSGARFPVLHYDNWHTHAFLGAALRREGICRLQPRTDRGHLSPGRR